MRGLPKWAFVAVVLLAIGVATLTPTPGATTFDFWCIACGDRGAVDVAANIVLFLPLGLALGIATGRVRAAIIGCVVTTLIIESLQIRIVAGRDSSISDILANSLGGVLGALIAPRWRAVVHPTPVVARRFAAAAMAVLTAVLALTVAGLVPDEVPGELWIQWAPLRAGYDRFSGKLVALDVNGIAFHRAGPVDGSGLDGALRQRSWRASALVETGHLEPGRSIIMRIADERSSLVSIEQAGRDLTCGQKTRAGEYRFRTPKVGLRDMMAESERPGGRMIHLICGRDRDALVAAVAREGHEIQERLALSPSLGWLLLSPFDLALDPRYRALSALWLAGLLFPVGYWSAATRDTYGALARNKSAGRWRHFTPALATLVVGFIVAPLIAGTAVASWWEWLAAVSGAALGAGLFSVVSRHVARADCPR